MKKNEFKKILKPLIEEAVKEVLLEPGILSRVIAEVAQGISAGPLVETKEDFRNHEEEARLREQDRQKRIKKLNESAGLNTGIFDGVSDIPDAPSQGALSGGLGALGTGHGTSGMKMKLHMLMTS